MEYTLFLIVAAAVVGCIAGYHLRGDVLEEGAKKKASLCEHTGGQIAFMYSLQTGKSAGGMKTMDTIYFWECQCGCRDVIFGENYIAVSYADKMPNSNEIINYATSERWRNMAVKWKALGVPPTQARPVSQDKEDFIIDRLTKEVSGSQQDDSEQQST